jgi:hypothetical protein
MRSKISENQQSASLCPLKVGKMKGETVKIKGKWRYNFQWRYK